MNKKHVLLSLTSTVLSFFLGYTYAIEQKSEEKQEATNEFPIVNIDLNSTSLQVNTNNDAIQIYINGEQSGTGEILFKK